MLFNCVVIIAKKQTAYCNPFRPVETRSDLLKPVETRFNPFRLTRSNLLKHVTIRSNTFPLPPPQKESGKGGGGGMEKGEGGKPGNGTDLNGLKRVSTGFNRSERIEIYFS